MTFAADFEAFWQRYPRKVGKLAARKAYEKARRSNGATHAELLAGIDAYVTHKPAYADYAHPATWLNAGRWMDEWGKPAPREPLNAAGEDWYAECQRLHGRRCNGRSGHATQMALDRLRGEVQPL